MANSAAPADVAEPVERPRRRLSLLTAHRVTTVVGYAISVAAGLVLWQFISARFFSPILFPPPSQVLPAAVRELLQGDLVKQAEISLARILAGFAVGSLMGTVIGLVVARIRVVRTLAEPWIQFLRFIPTIALLAPFIVWFGIGEQSKVGLITYTTTFIVMLNTMAGVYSLSEQKLRAARAFGANELQVLYSVIVPGCLPFILTGMRLAMGNSFMTVVAAELVAAESGLGFMINQARLFLDSTTIFVGIITLGLLGFATDLALVTVQNTLLKRYTTSLAPRSR